MSTTLTWVDGRVSVAGTVAVIAENEYVVIYLGRGGESLGYRRARAASTADRMVNAVRRFLDVGVAVGPDREARRLKDLEPAWRHAHDDLGRTFFGARPPGGSGAMDVVLLDLEQERALFQEIVSGDFAAVEADVVRLLDQAAGGGASRTAIQLLANDLVNLAIRVCKNRGVDPALLVTGNHVPHEAIADSGTISELREYVLDLLERLTSLFAGAPTSNVAVQRAVGMIRARFAEPLSLAGISAELGLSPCHLSRTFKAATGVGFAEFLTRTRIDAARLALSSGDEEIKRVARRCGFASYTYFFEVFRRHTGMTPQRFRETAAFGGA